MSADPGALDMAKIFGDDFVKDPATAKFKDPKAFAQSYKELQTQVGKAAGRVEIPNENTPPEQAKEFWQKMGVPDTAEGYELKPGANYADHENETNAAFLQSFSAIAKDLNLSKGQAEGMQRFFDDMTVKITEVATQEAEREDAQIDELYTKAFGDADKIVEQEKVKALIEKVVPENMRELLFNKVNNESLTFLALMNRHFEKTYGRSDNNQGDPGSNSGKTEADLRKESQDLYGKMLKTDKMSPEYKELKDRYDALNKTIASLTPAKK